jgi:hypothetical protein
MEQKINLVEREYMSIRAKMITSSPNPLLPRLRRDFQHEMERETKGEREKIIME